MECSNDQKYHACVTVDEPYIIDPSEVKDEPKGDIEGMKLLG
ncbi:MAG: hypothetical protein M0Z70_08305 [Nitrospiraceae bacterium]|jgi:hypothetical protein|nr:hypothetical protein [Nitrospiraceae bacterium]